MESALETFARFGYRKTSMEEVARAARISRPGLYFLFSSKPELFRAAVTRALMLDVDAVEQCLAARERSLRARVVAAFDRWTGRYIGPGGGDIALVVADSPGLVGPIVEEAPQRFEDLVTGALTDAIPAGRARATARTLVSVSVGLKHQVATREEFRRRMTTAADLLLDTAADGSMRPPGHESVDQRADDEV